MFARRAALLLFAALALAGCGGGDDEAAERATTTTAARAGVQDLDNVLQLRSDFEADQGKTRAIVVLAPT